MAHAGGGDYGEQDVGQAGMPRGVRGTVGRIGRPAAPPTHEDEHGELDWQRLAVFGAGLALGAFLGAGVSFFTAPVSGRQARRAVRRNARRALWRGQDVWEDLRDELSSATLRRKKLLRRQKRRAREALYEARAMR